MLHAQHALNPVTIGDAAQGARRALELSLAACAGGSGQLWGGCATSPGEAGKGLEGGTGCCGLHRLLSMAGF